MTIFDHAEKEMKELQTKFMVRNDIPTVLIVEDDPDYSHFLAEWVKPLNWYAKFAHDGTKALEIILANSIDLVWLDLNLPGMDGVMFLANLIKATAVPPPVIVVTGINVLETTRLQLKQHGILFISSKPENENDLHELLKLTNPKTKRK